MTLIYIMDKYPDAFNRQVCIDLMTKQQTLLIRETRKSFYTTIIALSEKCESTITLDFPDKLWFEHKQTLIKELLTLFGKIKIKIIDRPNDTILPITNIEALPKNSNIKKIIIEFPRD